MTQPLRVVVANQPRLIRELVLETIMEHPEIEIVAEIQNEDEIAQIVDGIHPDFLIMSLDESGQRPALCDSLLRRNPEMKILALAPAGNVSTLFWASHEIHSSSIEASETGILNTLLRKGQYVA